MREYTEREDTSLGHKMALGGRGKLLFKNGHIDFADAGDFRLYPVTNDDPFCNRIEYDYDPAETDYDREIVRRIFEPIFGTSEDGLADAECWKTYVAKGLACDIDERRWAIVVGLRDSGKSVLCAAIKEAFGRYAESFSATNMRRNDGPEQVDPELGWRFAMDFDKHHIVYSNDLRISKKYGQALDGGCVKTLTSGGDAVLVRAHDDTLREIVPVARMLICSNDLPGVDPEDAKSGALVFRLSGAFVGEKELNTPQKQRCIETGSVRYQKADSGIKAFCREPGFAPAFMRLILKAYKRGTDYVSPAVALASAEYQDD